MTRERDKLMRYGVIGDGARAGEVMGLMRDFTDATEAQRIAQKSGGVNSERQPERLTMQLRDYMLLVTIFTKLQDFIQKLKGLWIVEWIELRRRKELLNVFAGLPNIFLYP